jgi:hypothetical protein
MGGPVSVIVRKPDGEVVPMTRWTSDLTEFMGRIDLLRGDFDSWWKDYCAEWERCRADYEKNKYSGDYEESMTSYSFPQAGAIPDGYGVVVVDWPTRRIMHHQDYCELGEFGLYKLDPVNGNSMTPGTLMEMVREGFVDEISVSLSTTNRNSPRSETREIKYLRLSLVSTDHQKIQAFFEGLHKPEGFYPSMDGIYTGAHLEAELGIKIDPSFHSMYPSLWHARLPVKSDWKFERFEDSFGLASIRRELDDMGYVFTKEEDKDWKSFIKDIAVSDSDYRAARSIATSLWPKKGQRASP